jgi:hypothetical protein
MQLAYLNAAAVNVAGDGPGPEAEELPQPAASSAALAIAVITAIAGRRRVRDPSVRLALGGWVRRIGIVGGLL